MKATILTDKWYQTTYTLGDLYTTTLSETGTYVSAKVGLMRVSEIFSTYSYLMLSKNGTTLNGLGWRSWLLTKSTTVTYGDIRFVWCASYGNGISETATNADFLIVLRPVINIDNTKLEITSGNGAPNTPYIVKLK